MSDIFCKKCGEPWDSYSVYHDMSKSEKEKFLKGKGCVSCPKPQKDLFITTRKDKVVYPYPDTKIRINVSGTFSNEDMGIIKLKNGVSCDLDEKTGSLKCVPDGKIKEIWALALSDGTMTVDTDGMINTNGKRARGMEGVNSISLKTKKPVFCGSVFKSELTDSEHVLCEEK